ncbi:Cof-type HAD-IIB family hydrolase [Sporosarcina sp. YIM B06819]|uniref:Cof-type HAD-IIB family hydrolase n=1 Tax=Sporosarcina sp. YIM B06819 TaxID=3081769 RepID=UPI00298D0712|nr:Cof-type HAD-IIB family hydrolase [Sporosarcina sp. YIM B06819]
MVLKLIAIDLDGTLLSENGTISEANKEAILEVQKQGDVVAISSGRALPDVEAILQPTGIDCPIMTGNGAVTYYKGQEIQRFSLSNHVVEEVVAILEKNEVHYELYTAQGIFNRLGGKELLREEIGQLAEKVTGWAGELLHHYINHQYDLNQTLSKTANQTPDTAHLDVYKLLVLSLDEKKLSELREVLSGREDLSLTSSGRGNLELGHPDAGKGSALRFMANYLGIPLENTVAIGDNYNDLTMFEVAATSIAMDNAEEQLKELSTYVTKHHNEDGVAYALRTYVLHK